MTDRMTLLHRYLAEVRGRAFEPGKWDCALFAAGWVKACTGKDPARGWRGKYRSISRGLAMLRDAEGTDHVGLADRWAKPVSGWMQARPGDLAVVMDGEHPCFGIVGGSRIHVLLPSRGLDVVPLSRAERVFRP